MATRATSRPIDEPARIAALEDRIHRLEKINAALIDRVERASDVQGGAFSMFETAITLEALVRERTTELEEALAQLNSANAGLAAAHHGADAARARLRDAIESLADGFALFDAADRLVVYNQAYLKFWPELAEHENDEPTFAEVAERIAKGGRTVGSLVSPERWLADRLALHRNAGGAHVQALSDGRWIQVNELRTSEGGTVGIYTDITEVKAEDARERARELAEKSTILQSTLDTIRLGVAVYDAERRMIAWNGQLLPILGLAEENFSAIATHGEFMETCERLNGPFGAEQPLGWLPPFSPEVVTLRRQNSGRVIEVRRARMPDGGMVMTFEDVTERLQTAETLERRVAERTTELQAEIAERRAVETELVAAKTAAEHANRSKTSFIAAASHDLLQPLNAARLFVAALGERRLALPTRALVRQTGVALDSVEDLLEALFEISRLDAGAIQPEITAINLGRILATLKIEFGPLARSRELELEIPDTDLWVSSDLRLLRRILQNFLSNALRYTRQGAVRVAIAKHGDRILLSINDTGPGIAAADREVIFEEFRRLDTGQKSAGKGLGLSIVRRAGAMLGHRIELESQVGVGSTFSIELPMCAPLAQVSETVPDGPKLRHGREYRVLIIDNDESILAGMAALLSRWGYAVVTTVSGTSEMARQAVAEGIDLVIADYHLDGDERGD